MKAILDTLIAIIIIISLGTFSICACILSSRTDDFEDEKKEDE